MNNVGCMHVQNNALANKMDAYNYYHDAYQKLSLHSVGVVATVGPDIARIRRVIIP